MQLNRLRAAVKLNIKNMLEPILCVVGQVVRGRRFKVGGAILEVGLVMLLAHSSCTSDHREFNVRKTNEKGGSYNVSHVLD